MAPVNAVIPLEFEDVHEARPCTALTTCKPPSFVRLASLSLLQADSLCLAGLLLRGIPAACGTAGELIADKSRLSPPVRYTSA